MNKTLLVMFQEIRTTLRRKSFMFFSFGLPLLVGIIVLILIFARRNPDPVDEIEQPETEAQLSQGYLDEGDLIKEIPEGIPPDLFVEYQDEQQARSDLEAGEITGYYLIPPDYAERGDLQYVTDVYDPIGGGVNSGAIEWMLASNMLGDKELAARVMNPINYTMISLAPPEEQAQEGSWIVELLPNIMAFMMYLVILMTASILVAALTDEKKNRVLEVLLSSVSSQQLIAGKIIGAGILGLITLIAWIAVIWGVVTFGGVSLNIPEGFSLPSDLLLWVIVYAVLGYAMYGSQMAGLGALVPDIKEARGLTFIILMPLILVYMFLVGIIARPDGPVAVTLSLFPLTSPVAMITRMSVTDVPLWQTLLSVGLMVGATVFIIRMMARLFRAQILLSGQPVSVRRYYASIFGRQST
jgi:ABC-2 type transport system permease protein